mgnify:CR=1 FL=1
MNERPNLDLKLNSKTFKEYYYLKEELKLLKIVLIL